MTSGQGLGGSRNGRNLIKTRGGMMQSSLLKDRAVLTLGKRTDQNTNRPYRPNPLLSADSIDFDFAATEQHADTTRWIAQEGDTLTQGIVAKPLPWLNLHYNESDSFRPEEPRVNLAFELLGNPRTEGRDYGFSLNLFERKLAVRFNRYDVTTINSRNGESALIANRVTRIERSNDADPFHLIRQATAWVEAANPMWTPQQIRAEALRQIDYTEAEDDLITQYGSTETGDVRSKGDEIELFFNPNDFWTTKFNLTRSNTYDIKLAPGIAARLAKRLPLWTSIVDPRTNTRWWTTNYGGSRTAEDFYRGAVVPLLQVAQANEGGRRAQVREWRANLSTRYQLAGLSEQKHLKRMSVGGAIRWEDRGSIGYYGIPVNGDVSLATAYDKTRPIWSPANTYVDAFITYNMRLFSDKVRARFQLNGRPLLLQVQHVRSHLRLVESGRIATNALDESTQNAQVSNLRRRSETAQFKQFREADQRFRIGHRGPDGASGGSRFMGGHPRQ
ncbi:MAG: hypothetical protein ACREH8_23590 [Opitutaceae bacterium]